MYQIQDSIAGGPNKFEVNLGNFVAEEGKCLIVAWDLPFLGSLIEAAVCFVHPVGTVKVEQSTASRD